MIFEKWHPLTEIQSLRSEMDRIWQELIPSSRIFASYQAGAEKSAGRPLIDIIDKSDEVVVKADIPGVEKENVDITLQEDTLVLRGEIKNEEVAAGENCIYSERNRQSYVRTIDLPSKIDAGNIRANLKDGVLSVHLPKAKEQAKKIKVEVSGEARQ